MFSLILTEAIEHFKRSSKCKHFSLPKFSLFLPFLLNTSNVNNSDLDKISPCSIFVPSKKIELAKILRAFFRCSAKIYLLHKEFKKSALSDHCDTHVINPQHFEFHQIKIQIIA